jgi:hypothetical protein
MPNMNGRLEWDDDDLTPGKKREGGLHGNLYDRQGTLRGGARFIPDDGAEAEPEVVIHHVYHDVAPAAKTREQEELEQAVRELAYQLLGAALTRLKPHAKRIWNERAKPAIQSKADKVRSRRRDRRADAALAPPEGSPPEVVTAFEGYKADMSGAEARTRYVLALAARAFSDEQLRIVANANIVDDANFVALKQTMSELSSEQVATIIEALVANPSQGIVAIDAMWPPRSRR